MESKSDPIKNVGNFYPLVDVAGKYPEHLVDLAKENETVGI